MESFGLFSLLQSLLGGSSQENPPTATNNTATHISEKTDLEHEQTENTASSPTAPPPSSDAFLSFMQSHEERMQRIKGQKK